MQVAGASIWFWMLFGGVLLTLVLAIWDARRHSQLRRIGTPRPGTVTRVTRSSIASGKSIGTFWYLDVATTDLSGQPRSVKSDGLYQDPGMHYPPGSDVSVVFHPSDPKRYVVVLDSGILAAESAVDGTPASLGTDARCPRRTWDPTAIHRIFWTIRTITQ